MSAGSDRRLAEAMGSEEQAQAVSAALLALAARVDAVALAMGRAAGEVRAEWQGPHRSRFDMELTKRDAQAATVIADCRRLAAR